MRLSEGHYIGREARLSELGGRPCERLGRWRRPPPEALPAGGGLVYDGGMIRGGFLAVVGLGVGVGLASGAWALFGVITPGSTVDDAAAERATVRQTLQDLGHQAQREAQARLGNLVNALFHEVDGMVEGDGFGQVVGHSATVGKTTHQAGVRARTAGAGWACDSAGAVIMLERERERAREASTLGRMALGQVLGPRLDSACDEAEIRRRGQLRERAASGMAVSGGGLMRGLPGSEGAVPLIVGAETAAWPCVDGFSRLASRRDALLMAMASEMLLMALASGGRALALEDAWRARVADGGDPDGRSALLVGVLALSNDIARLRSDMRREVGLAATLARKLTGRT